MALTAEKVRELGSGRLSFDPGDLVAIGQVADALIKLHQSMGDNHE